MATLNLKQIKCACCGHVQNSQVLENVTSNLNLSNYNLFKSFNVQICQNCGYVSSNLEIKRETYPKIPALNESNFDFKIELINNIKIYEILCDFEQNKEIKLQLLASIFNSKKKLLNSVLHENYNTRNIDTINKIETIQKDLLDFTTSLLKFIKANKFKLKYFNDALIDVLKVELLCVISETNQAEELLKTLDIEDDRLLEYLECCIEIGGKLCFNL